MLQPRRPTSAHRGVWLQAQSSRARQAGRAGGWCARSLSAASRRIDAMAPTRPRAIARWLSLTDLSCSLFAQAIESRIDEDLTRAAPERGKQAHRKHTVVAAAATAADAELKGVQQSPAATASAEQSGPARGARRAWQKPIVRRPSNQAGATRAAGPQHAAARTRRRARRPALRWKQQPRAGSR
jgi:hypothetical protein